MDSYRRTFRWFTNHALVESVTFDAIKAAVGHGRSYGVFEILGTPDGFDFFASSGNETFEMGDEVALSKALTLQLHLPEVLDLPQGIAAPTVTGRIIHIDAEAKATTVAEGGEDLSIEVDEPGAYRAEVHIVPHHLAPFLGKEPERYIKKQIWIYANPIYVN
jgi:hypothetical protein